MTAAVVTLVFLQTLIGAAIVAGLQPVRTALSFLSLAMLVGLGVSSVVPLLLELSSISLTRTTLVAALVGLALPGLVVLYRRSPYLKLLFAPKANRFRLYELPFWLFCSYLMLISAWKCAWYPVIPFDTLVGPDLVATYAVREGHLISSIFTTHLPTASLYSNQPFYAPFTMLMQVMYLLTGLPFGKIWLTLLVVSFSLFLYAELRQTVHPLLVTVLLLFYWCSPELYAYTFLLQTDYANMTFFAASVWLLHRYRSTGQRGQLGLSILLMTLACWARSETIFFVPISMGMVIAKVYPWPNRRALGLSLLAGFLPALAVLFWNLVFVRGYLPIQPQLGRGLFDFSSFRYGQTYAAMNEDVIFNLTYWNYLLFFFSILTALNLILFSDRRGLYFLIWLAGLYGIFGLIIQHIEGANVAYTFRRGFFKFIPLMMMYLASTTLFARLSGWLWRKEAKALAHSTVAEERLTLPLD